MIGQVDRWASLYAIRPLVNAGVLSAKRGIPILMYHSVCDDHEEGVAPYYRLVTSTSRFRAQMQYLHEHRFEVIDLPEAIRRLDSDAVSIERAVVVTFDDGFDDFRAAAWPVLADFGFRATVFLPTAFIGESRRPFKGRPCLTWADVQALHKSGISFGAHTVNHPVLYGMPWPDIRRELRESRDLIEQQLQSSVVSFAYPFAFPQEDRSFTQRFTQEVADAGYETAVTTIVGRAGCDAHRFALSRLPVNDCDDLSLFETKLAGGYDWMGSLQRVVRRGRNPRTWISR
jgi:peptidoglycan/xylan/chitin deacetylase (PgdA/CDA1 family)